MSGGDGARPRATLNMVVGGNDSVGPNTRLTGDDPTTGVPPQRHRGCDLHSLEFSSVHPALPPMYLLLIYPLGTYRATPRRYILWDNGYGRTGRDLLCLRAMRARVVPTRQQATPELS